MVFPYTRITKNAQETAEVGDRLADYLKKPLPICLYGDLGSGKTTFIQGLAKEFGITTRLLSPTFIIVRRYQLRKPFSFFYHIDLYRIESNLALEGLGISEILSDASSVIAIEWAEKLGELIPEKRIDVHFKVLENTNHEIRCKKSY